MITGFSIKCYFWWYRFLFSIDRSWYNGTKWVMVQFSSVQSLSRVRLFATPWIAACQASLSITNSGSSLKLMPIELVMPSSHLILCRPLLLLPPILPSNLGSSFFSILSFYLLILFMGFSRQEYWSGLPFPSPVDHILSHLSTMTRLSWVAPHGMA